jgi:hypothetical protein
MRQSFGKITYLVWIKIFIAVTRMVREGKVPLKKSRFLAKAICLLQALPVAYRSNLT